MLHQVPLRANQIQFEPISCNLVGGAAKCPLQCGDERLGTQINRACTLDIVSTRCEGPCNSICSDPEKSPSECRSGLEFGIFSDFDSFSMSGNCSKCGQNFKYAAYHRSVHSWRVQSAYCCFSGAFDVEIHIIHPLLAQIRVVESQHLTKIKFQFVRSNEQVSKTQR